MLHCPPRAQSYLLPSTTHCAYPPSLSPHHPPASRPHHHCLPPFPPIFRQQRTSHSLPELLSIAKCRPPTPCQPSDPPHPASTRCDTPRALFLVRKIEAATDSSRTSPPARAAFQDQWQTSHLSPTSQVTQHPPPVTPQPLFLRARLIVGPYGSRLFPKCLLQSPTRRLRRSA